jgi:hypothetical protein
MANNKLVNTTKKLSRKQQSKVNKRLRQRTFKELNAKYKRTDIITKQSILDIAYRIFTINKYPYLTDLVKNGPQTYINKLFKLSDQYQI